MLYLALGGSELTKKKFEQGGLPRPVRPDDSDLVSTPDGRRKIPDDRLLSVLERNIVYLDDFLTRGVSLLNLDLGGTCPLASFAAFGAHRFECMDTPLVTGTAGLHSLADPGLFLGQLLIKGGPVLLLGIKPGRLALEIGFEITSPAGEVSAIKLDDAGGELAKEGSVVGDEEEGRFDLQEKFLQPEDRFEIEVVGRLVEQENVGLTH